MTEKILVVEDEPALLETLEYNLERHGFEVATAEDGLEALDVARDVRPDLLILDIMLPKMDGLEVCRILRREMNVPILMLTARVEEMDKVLGLEVGADDYLTKPFSMRELMARVRALLRRVRLIREEIAADEPATAPSDEHRPASLVFDDLVVDIARREARLAGDTLGLRPREFDLLAFLARNRGIVLSRDLLLEKVWGWSYGGGSRTVDVHVRWLRQKIEADPTQPTRILTVRGVGYRFEG
jgi:DNA-binding response OmpR family regulator